MKKCFAFQRSKQITDPKFFQKNQEKLIAGKNTGFNPNSERIYAQLTQPSQDFVYFFVYYQVNWSKDQQQPSGVMEKAVDIWCSLPLVQTLLTSSFFLFLFSPKNFLEELLWGNPRLAEEISEVKMIKLRL